MLRPGSGFVWSAKHIHVTEAGDIHYIGESFRGTLEDGPSSSAYRLDRSGTSVETAAGAIDLAVSGAGGRLAVLFRDGEASDRVALISENGSSGGSVEAGGRVESLAWSPDGKKLLLLVAGGGADVSGAEGGFALRGAKHGPSWLPQVLHSEQGDRARFLMCWDVDNGEEPRRVTHPPINVWEACWLGNDRMLAVASDHDSEGSWYTASLRELDLGSGVATKRFVPSDQIGVPAASPCGDWFAVIEAFCSDRGIVCGTLRLFRGAGGSAVTPDLGGVEASHIAWRNSRSILYSGVRRGETVVGEYDVESGTRREIWCSNESTISGWYPSAQPHGEAGAIVQVESYAQPPAIVLVGDGAARVIRSFAPGDAPRIHGRMAYVEWPGRDGLTIDGWLILPDGAARDLPLFVDVHGGPVWAHRNRYAAAHRANAALAQLGCAVLLPNPRGSGGRGQDYARMVYRDMGGEDAHDILCGIDRLVADGIVDSKRVAIFGSSYGGFMTAIMLAHHRRFAAAVAMSPVVNWYSQHFGSQIPWFDRDFLGGSPTAAGGPYFDRSPLFFLEGVTTPTLVVGGARDKNTPTDQAVELYNGLVEAGAKASLVIYPEDGHSMRGYPAYPDSAERIASWLEQHLELQCE